MNTATKAAGGFQFLEGPVWVPQRNELLFSDIPASRIYRWKDGQVEVWREPSSQANGNTLDTQGRLVTCEHENRRVSRTELDGTVVPVATHFGGKRLNSPNDVVCRSDGLIYFTDPPYGVKPELRELDFQGVYCVATDGLTCVTNNFTKPNGLAFSPDEKTLYIADTERGYLYAFDVQPTGELTGQRVFCGVERPDGVRVDVGGSVYVAVMHGIEIFDPTGKNAGEIKLPERPANLAFGGADRQTLFICARTSLYWIRVVLPGSGL